jgi:hypothetical protein
MVVVFCRAWLYTETQESMSTKTMKRAAPGTLPQPEGTRPRIFLEGIRKDKSINLVQLEEFLRSFGPSRFSIDSVPTLTEAKDDSRQPIVSPQTWRISINAFPPSLFDRILNETKWSINGNEFYCYCEGPNELSLEVVWNDSNNGPCTALPSNSGSAFH